MANLKELLNKEQTIRVVTHDGEYKAGEVASITLLKLFFPKNNFEVTRLPQETSQETLDQYDIIINIGKVFDPKNCRFVHNQYDSEKSFAGLVWTEIKSVLGVDSDFYPNIEQKVSEIDAFEKSIKKPRGFAFSRRILQTPNFEFAINFVTGVFETFKKEAEDLNKIKQIATSAEAIIDGFVFLPPIGKFENHSLWKEVINGELMPDISGIVRFNERKKLWEAILAPSSPRDDADITKGLAFNLDWEKELDLDFLNSWAGYAKEKEPIMALIKKYNEALENSKEG